MTVGSLRWRLKRLVGGIDPGTEVVIRMWDEAAGRFRSVSIYDVELTMDEKFGVHDDMVVRIIADEHLDEDGNELYYAHDRKVA